MSRQSEKPNAMFTGLGNTKRIVLGDTLLAGFSKMKWRQWWLTSWGIRFTVTSGD